jgi:hypothetical protein
LSAKDSSVPFSLIQKGRKNQDFEFCNRHCPAAGVFFDGPLLLLQVIKAKTGTKNTSTCFGQSHKIRRSYLKTRIVSRDSPQTPDYKTVKFPQSNSPLERGGELARRGVFVQMVIR